MGRAALGGVAVSLFFVGGAVFLGGADFVPSFGC